MTAERIARLLDDIRHQSEERFMLVQSLREQALGLGPEVTEEVKYGGLLYSAGKPFCGIFSYAGHVSLEFSAGASLPDRHKVLEGNGKLRRHIKLESLQDIERKHVHDYLVLAAGAR